MSDDRTDWQCYPQVFCPETESLSSPGTQQMVFSSQYSLQCRYYYLVTPTPELFAGKTRVHFSIRSFSKKLQLAQRLVPASSLELNCRIYPLIIICENDDMTDVRSFI